MTIGVLLKKNLKIIDLSRWLANSSKATDIEKKLFFMSRGQSEVILPDDKITRLIYILDEEGPIRYKKISFHPDGLGNLLCYLQNNQDKELLQDLLEAIDLGFIEGWISTQEQPDDYKPIYMGYNPRKIKFFLRNNEIGFGIERCIYEANPYITCQSEILKGSFVIGLAQLLSVLERTKLPAVEQNFDKHLIAYICSATGVDDTIKVKQLSNIPYFSKSVKLRICAIFALAQKTSGLISLPNIADWLKRSCFEVTEKINSSVIRSKIIENIDKSALTGDLNAFFQSIADSKLIKKDILGFQDAKKTFRILSFQKLKLQSQKSLDQIAYKMGLRISVIFSYLVCSAVFMIIAFLKLY